MRAGNSGLGSLARSVVSNHGLLLQLAKREYAGRFRGSIFGMAWAVLTPLVLAIAYTFVFAVIFKIRWVGGDTDHGTSFAVYLLVGLAIHGILAECLSRAPSLVLSNPSYVTKIVFPLEILAFTIIVPAIATATVNLVIVVAINLILTGQMHMTLLLTPFILGPYVLFIVALTMFLSAVGVYLRDLAHVVGLIVTLSLFLSPVFFSLEAVPPAMRNVMVFNPLTFPIEQLRLIVLVGKSPNWLGLMGYSIFSLAALSVAYGAFQRLRRGFSDVI